jgi:hypothetical protein
VADKKPDLLALQEATLWRTGASVDTATTVLFDQLQLLLSSLAADGVPYDIVAVDSLGDFAFPKASGGVLRFTDRDVLLIRAGLHPPEFPSIRPPCQYLRCQILTWRNTGTLGLDFRNRAQPATVISAWSPLIRWPLQGQMP